MNIFLTGNIGVGKSTIIDKVLESSGLSAGGFRTFYLSERFRPARVLYMSDTDRRQVKEAVLFSKDGLKTVKTSCFDEFGATLVRNTENSELIIMDELGRFEENASDFKQAVFYALSNKIHVLGVLRLSYGGWLDIIRSRPDIEIVTVTHANRDTLPSIIIKRLSKNNTD